MSTTPPPTTPAGAPPPPAQTTTTPEVAVLEGVVDALRPMFGAQAPNINTWETRCLVERLLNEKAGRGPLQKADATAKTLLGRAIGGWDNPSVKSGALLRAACVILNVSPVPAATQPPTAQPTATAPTWGDFPASLPGAAETATTDKAAKATKRVRKTLRRARRGALLIGVAAALAGVAGVIAGATGGWAAFAAALVAALAGVAGLITGINVYGGGRSRRRPRR